MIGMALAPSHTDIGPTLALAIISASQAPILLLDGDANVIAASDSFLTSFSLEEDAVRGQLLFSLGSGEWELPRLRSLLSAISSGGLMRPYELDFIDASGKARNLVLTAQRLDFASAKTLRILLTVVDATPARIAEKLKDDLVRDKDILIREVQHRVANSLQIIASVLLQNAKNVSSEESRTHLRDAHQRVMSVAAVQYQLVVSTAGDVEIKPYFAQLCQSIGASMIEDHDLVSIVVSGDDSTTSGEISVSLGLIVTELVINALKHAFPDGRHGEVTVDYQSENEYWELSVSDDGAGMAGTEVDTTKGGLGTAIVTALATQLHAKITVTDLHPGTGVSITHEQPTILSQAEVKPALPAV